MYVSSCRVWGDANPLCFLLNIFRITGIESVTGVDIKRTNQEREGNRCEMCRVKEGEEEQQVNQMYHYVAKEIDGLFRSKLDQRADH